MLKEKPPKLKIELEPFDWILEGIGIVAVVCLIALPFVYMDELPDQIPQHFDIHGQVDKYGGKGMLWFLPILGVVLYGGMVLLNRFPHVFNYPVKITHENTLRQYTMATRLIRQINTLIVVFFLVLSYQTIQISLGNQGSMSSWFVIGFLALIFGITIGYFVRVRKAKE